LNTDYLIVGAGVIGLATALELADSGASVTIIDRGRVGQESSWAGGGILSPLMPWDYTAPVNDLVAFSNQLYAGWVAELAQRTGLDAQWQRSGMLVLSSTAPERAVDWCAAHGMPLSFRRGREIVPDLAQEQQAMWLPDIAQVRNPRLTQALLLALKARQVTILEETEMQQLQQSATRLTGIKTSTGPLSAAAVIITGGAWSQSILGEYALKVDIRPVRGQMLLFKSRPGRLQQILYEQGTYIIPRLDGHVLTGSTVEDVGFDKSTTHEARELLQGRAARMLPWLMDAEFVQQWAGLRPGSPDSIPTIARHPFVDNLYINSGHFRYGVTMAPGSARLLANLLAGRPQPLDMQPYAWPA
jgi:glycine oxidase